MRKNQKRTLNEENRVYNTEWELLYYIILHENKMIYLSDTNTKS